MNAAGPGSLASPQSAPMGQDKQGHAEEGRKHENPNPSLDAQ